MSHIYKDGKIYRAKLDTGERVYLGSTEKIVKAMRAFKESKKRSSTNAADDLRSTLPEDYDPFA